MFNGLAYVQRPPDFETDYIVGMPDDYAPPRLTRAASTGYTPPARPLAQQISERPPIATQTQAQAQGDDRKTQQSTSGFGIRWDNDGLHIGDSIVLSPTMLIVIAGAIVLLQMQPVRRK